jgi:hypothetical protein
MKCKSCGKEILPDFKLCPYCGAPVESEEPEETVDYEQETFVFRPGDFTEKSQSAEPPEEPPIDYEDDFEEEPDDDDDDEYYEIPLRRIIVIIVAVLVTAGLVVGGILMFSDPLVATTDTIEAATETDPLSLVSLKDNAQDKYTVSVEQSDLNVSVPGEYTITYLLTNNSSGKTKTEEFTFTVVDTTAPVITASDTVSVPLDSTFTIGSYVTAIDSVDGLLSSDSFTVDGTVDTSTVGTYPITVTVSDAAGNEASVTMDAVVEDIGNTDDFFELLLGTWIDENDELMIQFLDGDDGYQIGIGYYQSEWFGIGSVRFVSVNAALTKAELEWDYTSYYYDEDTGETIYSDIQTVSVTIDTGKSGDNKITVDLGFGDGEEEFTYTSDD